MVLTVSGISIFVREWQPQKACSPISSSPVPKTADVRLWQSRNARFPMLVTLSGIRILDRLPQELKVRSSMDGMPSGSVTLSSSPQP